MNPAFVTAAAALALVALAHSVLGEILIFRGLRTHGVVPSAGRPVLSGPQLRIVWATWHVASVLCWALSALLWRLGTTPAPMAGHALAGWVGDATGAATLASGLLVLYATRGRHPAWVALLAVSALLWWP